MKKVEVKVSSDDSADASPVSVHVESKLAGGGWNRVDGRDLTTNAAKSETFQLRPGQRVVVEAFPTPEMVYDRDQGAAINPNTQRNEAGKADSPTDKPDQNVQKRLEQEQARLDKTAENMGSSAREAFRRTPVPETSNEAAMTKPGTSPNATPGHPGASTVDTTKKK